MPFQQRLTWDGVALHAGGLPGYPESHGCVHLPYEFARELFNITKLGVTVVVQGDAHNHEATSENSLLVPVSATGEAVETMRLRSGEQFRWHPELAPEGPLSIVIAKLDQRIVVLRNGVEIGRSVAVVDDKDPGSHVITLMLDNGKPTWHYVGMAGHAEDAGRAVEEADLNRVRIPRAFHELLKPEIVPGSTILVTNSRVGATSGAKLTVVDAAIPSP